MAYGRKWRPSKKAAREFAQKMDEVGTFCSDHGIQQSYNGDSYYFRLNGIEYRVSNHSVEASNRGAYDRDGNRVREDYHPGGRSSETVYIHASKTRIVEIYQALAAGKKLDGRGNEIKED